MMQDIFKQIANQRANASRTTVTSQRVIFQPTLNEFRKLDLKPLNQDTRRYPPGSVDGMQPQPRPSDKHQNRSQPMYPWVASSAK